MSQFSTSPESLGPRRHGAEPLQVAPVSGSLDAPGLITEPPVSSGAAMAAQLEKSLGLAGNLFGQIEYQNRVSKAEARRLQNEKEQEAAKAEALRREQDRVLHGNGVQQAREKLPLLKDAISKGLDGFKIADDPAGGANEILARETANMDPVTAAGFRSIKDELVNAGVERRNAAIKIAKEENTRDLASYVTSGQDPAKAVESAKTLGLTPTEIDTQILAPAAKFYASQGNTERVAAITAQLSRAYPDTAVELATAMKSAQRQAENDLEESSKAQLDAMNFNGDSFEAVREKAIELVNSGKLKPGDAKTRVDTARSLSQNRVESTIGNAISDRKLNEDDVRELFTTQLSEDPQAPNYLSQATRSALLERARNANKKHALEDQAARTITTGEGLLTKSQHGEAVTKLVGPEGAKIINEQGKITDPDALTTALTRANFAPPAIRQTIAGNLSSSNTDDVIKAATTIGLLAGSGSDAWLDVYGEQTSQVEKIAMLKARMEYESGGGVVTPEAAQRIRDLAVKVRETPELAREPSVEDLKKQKIDVANITKEAMNKVRDDRPWAIDTALGMDWLNTDPSLTDYGSKAATDAQRWFREYFTMARLSEPDEKAKTHAEEYVKKKVEAEYDYVRWGGEVRVVPSSTQDGLRLPVQYRWGEGHEAEAKADLDKLEGFNPIVKSRVVSMRPYHAGGSVGWSFTLDDGLPLTRDDGSIVLWTPSDKLVADNTEAATRRQRIIQHEREVTKRTTGYPIGY